MGSQGGGEKKQEALPRSRLLALGGEGSFGKGIWGAGKTARAEVWRARLGREPRHLGVWCLGGVGTCVHTCVYDYVCRRLCEYTCVHCVCLCVHVCVGIFMIVVSAHMCLCICV